MLEKVSEIFQKVFGTTPKPPNTSKEEIGYADPLNLFGSNAFQSYNPSILVTRQGMGVFDKMRLDDQVKASMEFKKHAVLSSGWEISSPEDKPDDWEVTEFIRWSLNNLEGTLEESLIGILTFLDYGFGISEKVYNTLDTGPFQNKIGLVAIKDKKPHFFNFKVDKFGNLEELLQTQVTKRESLPPDKFIIYVHGKEFGNWYGRSDLEAAYRPWWAKTNAYQWLVMYLERMGIPPIFALYDPTVYSLAQKNDLKAVMTSIQAATSGIMPRPTRPEGKGTESLDFWTPELSKQAKQVFIPSIDMFNRDISRAILMPGLLGFTPDEGTGSLARAKKHFDVFLMVVEYLRLRIEKRVMMEQVINPLVDLNYSGIDNYPKFKFLPITDETRADLLDRWITAVDKGIVVSQEQDEKHIRSMLKFPEKEEELDDDTNIPEDDGTNIPEDDEAEAEDDGNISSSSDVDSKIERGKRASENTFKLFINEAVDFVAIEDTLDEVEEQTITALIKVLTKSRDALVKFVGQNVSDLTKKVIDLRLRNMADIQSIFGEFLRTTFNEGSGSMQAELKKLNTENFVDSPQFTPTEALRWLSQKKLIISGVLRDDLMKDVRLSIMSGIENGESIGEIQARIKKDFTPYIGDTSVVKDQKQIKPFRLETIVRTNATAAFNQGRIVEARKVGKFLQGMRYSAILDSRTTEVCTLLDGTIFKMGDSAIDSLRPPRHFNALVEGTKIKVGSRKGIKGYLSIEDIKVGDYVQTHLGRLKPVTEAMKHETWPHDKIILHFGQGKKLEVTEDHPILTSNRGWVCAGDLTMKDKLVSKTGPCLICNKWITNGQRYCSYKCSGLSRTSRKKVYLIKYCKTCNNEILGQGILYCSHECYTKRERKAKIIKYPPRACLECGTMMIGAFIPTRSNGVIKKGITKDTKFCSRKCYRAYIGPTSIELITRDWLVQQDIDFIFQKAFGKYCVDFYLPFYNLIIEADGEYWHSTEKQDSMKVKKRNDYLIGLGFDVLHIPESAVKSGRFKRFIEEAMSVSYSGYIKDRKTSVQSACI